MKKTITISVITGILTLTLGFFGGLTYQKSKTASQFMRGGNRQANGTTLQNGVGQRNGALRGNAPVSGKIISLDTTSLTVQIANGSNKIVVISNQTKVNKTQDASITDLKMGDDVMIIGTQNTNGSVTAQSISLGRFTATPSAQIKP